MLENCTCESAFGNTGVSNCELIKNATYSVILQAKYKADGTLNYIDTSNPATIGATVLALTTAVTPALERLYPLPVAENVTMEQTETGYETAPSNRKYKTQDGVRTNVFQFLGVNSSFRFLGELDKFGCKEMVYFIVDSEGSLFGQSNEAGKLYGVPVASNTFDTMLMHASDTTVQKIQLQFDTQFGFNDSMWKGITANDLGYNAQDLRGLITVNGAVFGTPTATEVVVDLFRSTNSAVTPTVPFVGLVLADWTLTEVSPTAGAIVVATAVESTTIAGRYTITFASQTSDDVLEVSATRGGFEVLPVRFVIP